MHINVHERHQRISGVTPTALEMFLEHQAYYFMIFKNTII